ncbi:tetratricopeptide repeat protein [Amycolatopsis jejuensis]|uniref:tetratricopeptide repeat protein n=1 Tax=Amycolatopsis jejuensis TaxID=330084 RepID=UPI001B808B47|nr:tetratricopeptide repeat protein [Amycolatopsis jejuensis]
MTDEDSDETTYVNRISGGTYDKVVMAGAVHGDVNVGYGDRPEDLADPIITSVRLVPGGTLADLVIDSDPPQVAVPGGTVHVITVEAKTTRAVVLHSARPVIVSRTLPRPACLLVRVGATLEPRRFTTDFDAQPLRMQAQGADFPFTVSATDVEQFQFEPVTRTHEIAWHLELDWTCAGRSGTTIVDNHGEPFRVYPVAALFDGRDDSVLNSGCDLFHERGCPAGLLEATGQPASLWDGAGPLPLYPAPAPIADEDPEDVLRGTLPTADPDLPESWPEYRRIATSVRRLAARPGFRHQPDELLLRVLRYLFVSGQSRPGAILGRRIRDDWAEALGEDHPDTLAAANRLAGCLIGMREYPEARDLLSDLLPRFSRVLGEEHRLTLIVASNLCVVHMGLDEYEKARDQTKDVIRRTSRALGPDDPGALRASSNLVAIHRRLGDRSAALAVLEDILPRYRRTLGDAHPDTRKAAATLEELQAEG